MDFSETGKLSSISAFFIKYIVDMYSCVFALLSLCLFGRITRNKIRMFGHLCLDKNIK